LNNTPLFSKVKRFFFFFLGERERERSIIEEKVIYIQKIVTRKSYTIKNKRSENGLLSELFHKLYRHLHMNTIFSVSVSTGYSPSFGV